MQSYLERFPGCRVAVIGDIMLDCYVFGEVNRISPEAPVPVVRVTNEKAVPGGAANVAANLASLGLQVSLVGLAGLDAAHDELTACLDKIGAVDCSGIVAVPERVTIRKLRIIAAHQQIVRVDHEENTAASAELGARLIEASRCAIDAADVVVVSDYGKGVCSDAVLRTIINHGRAAGKSILVDPKRLDLSAYSGATVITPNRKELADATGMPTETDAEAASAAARAQRICEADVLLTRSEKGMSWFPLSGEPVHLATAAQDVFDVSGAGDTVVAVLAAAMAAGMPFADGMRMANHAAGIVVSKLGTASVSRDELAAALHDERITADVHDGGLVDREGAVALRALWARDKLTVGVSNGCFDLLHPGHVSLIRQAADSCDRLIMAINSDASVKRLKGQTRPVQDEQARAEVLGAIKGVAAVTIFHEDTPRALIEMLQPDVLVKGSDYTVDQVVGADIVRACGGRIVLVEISPGQSTSKLIAASRPADVAAPVHRSCAITGAS